eukprot:jgi/Chlat1/8380/Chrsp80S07820
MGNPIYQPPKSERRPKKEVYVQLCVRDSRGCEVYFKMKRRMPLGYLQDAYCQRERLDGTAVEFFYKGRRVSDQDTPDLLEMKEVDCIEVNCLLHSW